MKISEAFDRLQVPADVANNNAVQDAILRLRDALALASGVRSLDAEAPDYLIEAVAGLDSWIENAKDINAWRRAF